MKDGKGKAMSERRDGCRISYRVDFIQRLAENSWSKELFYSGGGRKKCFGQSRIIVIVVCLLARSRVNDK